MIVCTNCGRENEDHYKYCLGCGTVLPSPKVDEPEESESPETLNCPNCSAQVPSNFKFCGACGTEMPAQATPVEDVARQQAEPASDPKAQSTGAGEPIAHLVVIKPDGSEGARIPVPEGDIVLGRESEHEVLSGDPFLSPRHASLLRNEGGGFTITDHDSLNGVFVRIRGERELSDGDFLRLGQELLHFQRIESVQPLVAKNSDTLTAGSPDAGYWGRLSLIGGPDLESRGFVFSQDEITLGREVGDILFRDDGFVSGKHARIAKVEGKAFIKDLGSSNGTYVRIRDSYQVQEGDLILMGQQLFKLTV